MATTTLPVSTVTPIRLDTGPVLGLRAKRTDIYADIIIILSLAFLYGASFIAFLIGFLHLFTFEHGYPRADLMPGTFVSDRYSFQWWLLLITMIRPAVFLLSAYMLKRITTSWRKNIQLVFVALYIFLDIFLIIALWVILCFNCNSASSGGSICNDAQWCEAFSAENPDRCVPAAMPVDPTTLTANPAFLALFYFTLAWLLVDVVLSFMNGVIRQDVRKWLNRSQQFVKPVTRF